MKKVEIEDVSFDTRTEALNSENYPNSGLFIVETDEGESDLVLVNKYSSVVFFIAPKSMFNNTLIFEEPIEHVINNSSVENNKYGGDFILEFSRILLNRK